MNISSQREILRASPVLNPGISGEIAAPLVGTGPARSFGEVHSRLIANDIALVIGTSGSTGLIKEVAFTRRTHCFGASVKYFYWCSERAQWSLLLPVTHIAAVNVIIRSMEP